jgi:hypothetical protein
VLHFCTCWYGPVALTPIAVTVLVYDVRGQSKQPIYQASVKTGKHSEPVWQVFWQVDEMQKALQFVSISSDGRVTLWTLSKSELAPEETMRLKLPTSEQREDDAALQAMAGGVCMDFNKVKHASLLAWFWQGLRLWQDPTHLQCLLALSGPPIMNNAHSHFVIRQCGLGGATCNACRVETKRTKVFAITHTHTQRFGDTSAPHNVGSMSRTRGCRAVESQAGARQRLHLYLTLSKLPMPSCQATLLFPFCQQLV